MGNKHKIREIPFYDLLPKRLMRLRNQSGVTPDLYYLVKYTAAKPKQDTIKYYNNPYILADFSAIHKICTQKQCMQTLVYFPLYTTHSALLHDRLTLKVVTPSLISKFGKFLNHIAYTSMIIEQWTRQYETGF